VIALHPGVNEVGVIGIPDEKSGEVVAAIVVKNDPTLTEQDLKAYCREELTNYKRPKFIFFATDLPKTNIGKILRRELRDKYINSVDNKL
jgi:long-chain acyl-CoA synthetase